MSTVAQPPRRVLRLKEVMALTGLSRSSIYKGMQQGAFPKSAPLIGRAVGWFEDEIALWQAGRIALRDGVGRPRPPTTTPGRSARFRS